MSSTTDGRSRPRDRRGVVGNWLVAAVVALVSPAAAGACAPPSDGTPGEGPAVATTQPTAAGDGPAYAGPRGASTVRASATPAATVPQFAFAEGERAIDADPPPLATARLLLAVGRRPDAEATIEAIVAAGDPGAAKAAVAMSGLRLEDSDAEAALRALESAGGSAGLGGVPVEGRYRLGQVLERLGWPAAAAEAYRAFGEAQPAVVGVAAMAAGGALFDAGDYAGAAEAFARARDSAGDDATRFLAALRHANALLRRGDTATTVRAYEDAFALATADHQRAQALDGLIATYARADRIEDAHEVRLRLVASLPATDLARAALDRLAAGGRTVSPTLRAAVLNAAGEHAAAAEALSEVPGDGQEGEAAWLLEMARAHRGQDRSDEALALLAALTERHPDDALAPEAAWLEATALSDLGRPAEARNAYRALADRWPGSPLAEDALRRWAALVASQEGHLAGAGALDVVASRHATSDRAVEDAFRAAMMSRRGGDVAAAAERLEGLASRGTLGERARTAYWLGRLKRDAGDRAAAESHWEAAARLEPMGYYGVRAKEMLGIEAPPVAVGDTPDAVADWIATWGGGGGEGDAAAWIASAAARPGVARARAWLALGDRKAASAALGSERRALAGDAAALAALAFASEELGVTEASAAAAERVLNLAPPEAVGSAPRALWQLAYPAGFAEDVRMLAEAEGVEPAALWSVIRQESRFEPTATSSAGAAGLTQVMPATGEHIAAMLGIAGFATSDLYDPRVGLRFGAWYLARQMERYDGRLWAALAAYNGGPGNADRWWAAAGDDQDAFVESVDFAETRSYLRRTLPGAAVYRWLYPGAR